MSSEDKAFTRKLIAAMVGVIDNIDRLNVVSDLVMTTAMVDMYLLHLKADLSQFDEKLTDEHRAELNAIWGSAFKKRREQLGISIDSIAAQLDVTPTRYTAYEEGECEIPNRHVGMLLRFFEMRFGDLVADEFGPTDTTDDDIEIEAKHIRQMVTAYLRIKGSDAREQSVAMMQSFATQASACVN